MGFRSLDAARALVHAARAFTARGILLLAMLVISACAAKTPLLLPSVLPYPDFPYPTVPAGLKTPQSEAAIDLGWRYLQNDDLAGADREFSAALKRTPGLYPALTGRAYVAEARKDHEAAVREFDAALKVEPRYLPAL